MTDKEKAKANLVARAIASDISIYNEALIAQGIAKDNFFDALKEFIDEGRDLYKKRVSEEIYTTTNFYDRAIVDVILARKGSIKSKIW